MSPLRRDRWGEWPWSRNRIALEVDGTPPPPDPTETYYAIARDGAIATAQDGAQAVWRTEDQDHG